MKISLIFISVMLIFFLIGCENKKENEELAGTINNNLSVKENVIQKATEVLGVNVKEAFQGNFDEDDVKEIAVGIEISDNNNWGIKFSLLKEIDNDFKEVYSTKLLDGSFRESMLQKIKFPSFPYELLYYNSQDFFMGSGGGEIFAYIIDFNNKEIYYAHLFSGTNRAISLYLSDNILEDEIRNFFLNLFKKDFPKLTIIKKDIKSDL